ncbi:hypothetical protein PAPYR_6521 [Paratrimastix pyriformis]|uniref:TmcB/TmcC TPR repeats domain-containing protein n=1 Tax=Paratrimastix pyriformis TaxID=342808 RepID=A0ABQ8UM52_9EUKA|nr:hypothetical protein PAPYR_6521 [Paratrimastix pyriformis]
MQREELINKFERGLFALYYLLKLDSAMPRLKGLCVLYFFQTIQLVFIIVAIPTVFYKTQWVQIPLYLIDFSFSKISPLTTYISFGICAGFTVLIVLCAILCEIFFHKDSGAVLWPLRFVRWSYFIFTWVFLIPVLGSFLDILDCRYLPDGTVVHDLFPDIQCWAMPHIIPSVVALVVLTIFLISTFGGAILSVLLYFHRTASTTVCKCLIVCAGRVLTAHTVLRAIIILVATALMLGLLVWMMPYHTRLASMLYTAQYWLAFLAALEWTILNVGLPQWATEWAPFVVFAGVCLLTTPIAVLGMFIRYNRTLALPRATVLRILAVKPPPTRVGPAGPAGGTHPTPAAPQESPPAAAARPPQRPMAVSPSEALLAATESVMDRSESQSPPVPSTSPSPSLPATTTSTLALIPRAPAPAKAPAKPAGLTPAQLFSRQAQQSMGMPLADVIMARCFFSWQVEWATRYLRCVGRPRSVGAGTLYAKGMSKFPESHGLLLNYAEFMQAFQRNPAASIALIRRASGLAGSALDTRFAIYSAERTFETAGEGSSHSAAGFMSALTLKRHMRQAQANHKRAKKRLARVWAFLMRPHYEMRSLPPLLDSAVAQANTALESYASLLQSFPSNVTLLRAYGSLLQDLYGDTELADSIFTQADQMEDTPGGPGAGDDLSLHSARVAPSARPRAAPPGASGTGPQPAPMVKAPSVMSRRSHGGKSALGEESKLSEGGGIDYRGVLHFLMHRHDTTQDETTGDDDDGRGCSIPRMVGLVLFGLHLVAIAVLGVLLFIQSTAISGSTDLGIMVRGTANCSLLVEKVSYEARKLVEMLLVESGGQPTNVTFGAESQTTIAHLTRRMFTLATTLAELLLNSGAKGDFKTAWMTWSNPVLLPAASDGVLATMTFDTLNLTVQSELLYLVLNGPLVLGPALTNMSTVMALSHDSANFAMTTAPAWSGILAGVFFLVAGVSSLLALGFVTRERKAVLHYYFNLPKELIQSEYTRLQKQQEEEAASEAGSVAANETPTGGAAPARLRLRPWATPPSQPPCPPRCIRCPTGRPARRHPGSGRHPKAFPGPPVLEEDESASHHETSYESHTVATSPEGPAAHLGPVLDPVVASALPPLAPADPGSQRTHSRGSPAPASSALLGRGTPLTPNSFFGHLPEGGPICDSVVSLPPAMRPTMALDISESHAVSDISAMSHPSAANSQGVLAALLLTQGPRGPSSLGQDTTTDEDHTRFDHLSEVPQSNTDSRDLLGMTLGSTGGIGGSGHPHQVNPHELAAAHKYSTASAAGSEQHSVRSQSMTMQEEEEEDEAAMAAQVEANRKKRIAEVHAEEERLKERERNLKQMRVLTKGIVTRVLTALFFGTLFIVITGVVGLTHIDQVAMYSTKLAAYGGRLSELGQTSNLAYQLVHNRSFTYLPFADQDPAVDIRIRQILSADTLYPGVKTSRTLLRTMTRSALTNLTAISRAIRPWGKLLVVLASPIETLFGHFVDKGKLRGIRRGAQNRRKLGLFRVPSSPRKSRGLARFHGSPSVDPGEGGILMEMSMDGQHFRVPQEASEKTQTIRITVQVWLKVSCDYFENENFSSGHNLVHWPGGHFFGGVY